MTYEHRPKGVCAQLISLELREDGTIANVHFQGGCAGNAQGVAALVKDKKPEEVIPILEGIVCGSKSTSCPNELSRALKLASQKQQGV